MRLLAKPLSLTGTVIGGEKMGRTIGFPTANLKLSEKLKLSPGIYVALCQLKRKTYFGLAYYGKRYIFGEKQNSFEVFLLNFSGSIYGQKLKVKLTHFIRVPKKLTSKGQVKKALEKDVFDMQKNQAVLVNSQDKITGLESVIKAHRNPPRLHRASSVYLFNRKGELLVQQRSKFKPLWPLYWSNTSCTNTRPGETAEQAAKRCLENEMGLKVKLEFQHKFVYKAKYNSHWSEYEVDSVFTGLSANKPKLNLKEAADYRYLGWDELKKDVADNPQKYTPWFKLTLKKLKPSDIFNS